MKCIITTEGFGDMVFDLFPEIAPITTENFVKTAESGFYDGLAWCRIVKDYVIQAGSPDNDIMTDSEWHIKGEFAQNGIENPIPHKRGPCPWQETTASIPPEPSFLWSIRTPTSWTAGTPPSAS